MIVSRILLSEENMRMIGYEACFPVEEVCCHLKYSVPSCLFDFVFFVCLFVCLLPVEEVCHYLRSGEDDDRHQIVCFLFSYLFQWFFLSRFLSVAYFFWLHLFVTCLRSLPPSPELRGQ